MAAGMEGKTFYIYSFGGNSYCCDPAVSRFDSSANLCTAGQVYTLVRLGVRQRCPYIEGAEPMKKYLSSARLASVGSFKVVSAMHL